MTGRAYKAFLNSLLAVQAMVFLSGPLQAQGGRYWDQNLNSEAALLSGAVVAGEAGIAAIYYNPATIPEMTTNNLSLSANLFSLYFFNAKNALGYDLPADRIQFDVYPRIITLTINPVRIPEMTIELAFYTKTSEYMQINKGTSQTTDIISSHPGEEEYVADYYLRSKFEEYHGGAGFGYKLSDALSLGFSGLISYKDDQYYNLVSAGAFTQPEEPDQDQYLSGSGYHIKFTMFDVRLVTKLGLQFKQDLWTVGATLNLPSVKLFGNGTVVKQYEYSNIHGVTGNLAGSDRYYSGRQRMCPAHFKDPLSIAAGANYYTPSGRDVLLVTAEYFFGISSFEYIEAGDEPGEDGYNYSPVGPAEWLTFTSAHRPVLNAGIALKHRFNERLVFSGGFRTDFNYLYPPENGSFLEKNRKTNYIFDVYHVNSGLGFDFDRGSITIGMQYSYGRANQQRQIVNLTNPVEYITDEILPLTGYPTNEVTIRYNDLSIYCGFIFDFIKKQTD